MKTLWKNLNYISAAVVARIFLHSSLNPASLLMHLPLRNLRVDVSENMTDKVN